MLVSKIFVRPVVFSWKVNALLPSSSFILSVHYDSRSYQLSEVDRGLVPFMMGCLYIVGCLQEGLFLWFLLQCTTE